MTEILTPDSADHVCDMVAWAASTETAIATQGHASKNGLGHPVDCSAIADLSRLSGILSYAPEELVLTAKTGTPIRDIDAALAENRQQLAFEPPDWGIHFGAAAGRGTIGGILACNASGPRRFKSGAARDHFLGVEAVSGRGERFRAGGKVVKNVTGYDLCKLLAGSYGTLGIMTEVTVKVLPAPDHMETLILYDLDDDAALSAMSRAASSTLDVSGIAHFPAAVSPSGRAETLMRVEGPAASVGERVARLQAMVGGGSETAVSEMETAHEIWRGVRDARPFAGSETPLWRMSLPPAEAARAAVQSGAEKWFFDWAGGLVWLLGGTEQTVRSCIAECGGHATLFRAADDMRGSTPVFQPVDPALARLNARVRNGFDPLGILNPGRLHPLEAD